MPSRARPGSLVGPDRSRPGSRDQDLAAVEIDSNFAKAVGLAESQKVGLLLHLDPPVAHTVNIEPLTPEDWEVIELHATFLELNLLSQIRALPNPSFISDPAGQAQTLHPLTLYLSPTSTANIRVTSLVPEINSTSPFAKIASDAEVIVAPKVRAKTARSSKGDSRSIASRRSGRSGASTRQGSNRKVTAHGALYLRAIDRQIGGKYFDADDATESNEGLHIWLSKGSVASEQLQGARWGNVSLIRPAGLRSQLDQSQMQRLKDENTSESGTSATKFVAYIHTWRTPPDEAHVAVSSQLCQMLGVEGMVGNVVRIEAASYPMQRYSLKTVKFFPFAAGNTVQQTGLKFGGNTRLSRSAIVEKLRAAHGSESGLLAGPLMDGMILPPNATNLSTPFTGGVIRLVRGAEQKAGDNLLWALGSEQQFDIDIKDEIPRPLPLTTLFPTFSHGVIPLDKPLVGIETPSKQLLSNLSLSSSVLLSGSIGSGKTALAHYACNKLRRAYIVNTTYFPCSKLVTDETRITTIKDNLTKLFMSAAWCARLGGASLVVLDDLDKICPVEAELQVGNDNERSRQISELLCSVVRYYCAFGSGVTLLATAQSKDALNSILIGGHIFGEIIPLHAPDKETRRKVLAQLTSDSSTRLQTNGINGRSNTHSDDVSPSEDSWMDPSNSSSRPNSSASSTVEGFRNSADLDLLDIAGKTDGYMPADLDLLTSRARKEALSRTLNAPETTESAILLTKDDFASALENFTPSSLRNVTLTHSTTTFASIGGLKATRSTLLETLLYPTKYAPIFANSPLRLRSGLLLYGYPGCGKTLLASAVAGECNLNFISVKGPEILNKYIGASEKSVRDLFERAQSAKPCVLFFDEFDAIAPKRGHDSTGVTDRVVNQMLTQMDGAEGLEGVYVLAATSRPDLIDPALLRPGRLDKSLLCDMPTVEDRLDILRAVSEKLVLNDEASNKIDEIAERTEGLTGADLQALMYNAHLEAIHDLLGDSSNSKKSQLLPNGTKGTKSHSQSSKKHKTHKHDFIQFLYSADEDAKVRSSGISSKAVLDSRAAIAAKLDEIKLVKQRERQMQKGSRSQSQSNDQLKNDEDEALNDRKDQVIITWSHIERSLASTRSSISPAERRRLAAIYEEFVVGRNGEMPSGQGGNEIGGRSSLM